MTVPPHESAQFATQGKAGRAPGRRPGGLLALAIAGLADLGLVEPWASGGTRPILEKIPELVLTLLLGTPSAPGADS